MQGFDSAQMLLILGFQALLLGLIASLVGVALGEVLSRTLFHRVPVYLAVAFPISPAQLVHLGTVLLALGAGVVADAARVAAAAARPARAPANRRRVSRRARGGRHRQVRGPVAGGRRSCTDRRIVTVLVLVAPQLTVLGGMALALAAIALIPAILCRRRPSAGDGWASGSRAACL